MSLESPSGTTRYRLIGRARIEARLLPLLGLLLAVPWAVATVVMLWSLTAWAGRWATTSVVVVWCLIWCYALVVELIMPDELTIWRHVVAFPDTVPCPPERFEPATLLFIASWEVMRAAGRPETWLRIVLRTRHPRSAGRSHPRRRVSVPISAVNELPPLELRAVIAHEFGHQLIGGWTVRGLESLCTAPVVTVFGAPATFLITVLSYRRSPDFVATILLLIMYTVSFAALVGALLPTIGLHLAQALAIVCLLQPFPKMWVNWREEFLADQVAVDLGYGPALHDYLVTYGRKYGERFSATHPDVSTRRLKIRYRTRPSPSPA
ncbi:M48 family metalloprotease [Nocardia sp. NPDC059228]|uniref:M48 family metalloprotease n=1 Tax=Nocardia sp. NPDC059228 TaxID=3346777 RepID=UPI0036C4A9B7